MGTKKSLTFPHASPAFIRSSPLTWPKTNSTTRTRKFEKKRNNNNKKRTSCPAKGVVREAGIWKEIN